MNELTSAWPGRRVLVTGCTGFLGGAVVRELLGRGSAVVGLVRDRAADADFARHKLAGRAHVVYGRVEDTFRLHSALAVHEVGTVFHLAAADPNHPDRGTATVLEAVRRYDPRVPVIVARPTDGAMLASVPVPVGIARFGALFGPGDRKMFRPVAAAVLGQMTGERTTGPSDGTPRDHVFVRDAARACVALAEEVLRRPEPHIADETFRSGWRLTDRELMAAVRDVFEGRPPRVSLGVSPPNALGWAPAVSFTDALTETVEWYREFFRGRPSGAKPLDSTRQAA